MRIATYNIWNSREGWPERLSQVVSAITACSADIVALQEVRASDNGRDIPEHIQRDANYEHMVFCRYHDENEGLAVLSREPIELIGSNWDALGEIEECTATLCRLEIEGRTAFLTNVHLGWRSIISKERQIRRIVDWSLSHAADLHFLCGDLNSAEESSVVAYLSGYRSLMESETTWINLVRAYEVQTGLRLSPTLDFQNNARWTVGPATTETPATVDWIFYRPNDLGSQHTIVEVKGAGLFGTDIGDTYHPSDHFGLYVDVDLSA